ncbi:TetR/AcrR family transcriptional regulator [Antrihabitans cavernicola]|uniref:TetR/AcrR family transcriptional regulator n=1 Tax=Antrihabitans cavernicola TaxID=2495913 RepID=A0A5A7SBE7_9NOCA|nr:TetR/AcrR family transcriptional regulator [Spelaeibacter cavernicola]KAA0022854.1 TetR/AcrR family transcriptional regulator [Spelaeibacter cavernicola]
MAIEHSGSGDPRRTVELLWGTSPRSPKGPKPRLTVAQVTAAAVALADAEGLQGFSIRRLADTLGVSAMSLYTYVPTKAELIDLMVDHVSGETLGAYRATDDWRAGLESIAQANWILYQRHPWLLAVSRARSPLGPNVMDKYERELSIIDGIGLTDVEMDSVLSLVLGHTESTARRVADAADAVRRSGLTDTQWWEQSQPALDEVVDASRYPTAQRVGEASGQAHQAASDANSAFGFGLARILDGIEALVAGRRG